MATSAPNRPPNVSLAPKLLIPTWIMFAIAVAVYAVRIRSRIRMVKRFYADDYAITLAMLALAFEVPAMTVSCHYGLGRHGIYLSPASIQKATFYLYIAIFPFYICAAAARVSIGLTLLRLKHDSRVWTRTIWGIIIGLTIHGIANTVVQFTQCIPVQALWNAELKKHATCMSVSHSNIWGWVSAAVYIISDLIFSVLPLTFVPSLHVALRQKFLICVLMSLGMLASAFSMVKIIYRVNYAYRSKDKLWDAVDMSLWSKMEEILIAVAACAPTLKAPADRVCTWFVTVYRNLRKTKRDMQQPMDGEKKKTAGLDKARDGEGFTGARKMDEAKTDEEDLRPKWWFPPHGFIHTDLITTIDLNRRSEYASQAYTTRSDGETGSNGSSEFSSVTDSSV